MKGRVVFYVSGHGFGHSTHIQEVINHLPPDRAEVMIRTSVAECLGTRTPLLYTSRGEFAEYDVLVEGMTRFIPCRFVTPEKLPSGEVIDDALRFLSELSWNGLETPRTDGADVVANRLMSFV